MMQIYELGYLILPSIAEDATPQVVEKMNAVISKAGGKALDSETPFKYDLAYTMTKTIGASRYVVSDAYIGWLKFELEPGEVEAVKDELENMDELLRLILVKAPRETTFTFAKAKALLAEKEAALEEKDSEEVKSPVEEVIQ